MTTKKLIINKTKSVNKDERWIVEDCWGVIKEYMIEWNIDYSSKKFRPSLFIRAYPTPFWKNLEGDKWGVMGYLIMSFEITKRTPKMVSVRQLRNNKENGRCVWNAMPIQKPKRVKIREDDDGEYCEVVCMYSGDKIKLYPYETGKSAKYITIDKYVPEY